MLLFPGEMVYDTDAKLALIGFGRQYMDSIEVGGVRRVLSRCPPPADHDPRGYSREMDAMEIIPESEWEARIKEKIEQQSLISDFQNWTCQDQGHYPTCWANGPAGAAGTQRVIQGQRYREISGMSIAWFFGRGHSGGYEGNALKYSAEHGWAFSEHWGNRDATDHSQDPDVLADRPVNRALEWVDLGSDPQKLMTALLNNWPVALAFNGWSHVTMAVDPVDAQHYRIRNNWGDSFGAKNRYGFGGYAVFPLRGGPHGSFSSGYALRQQTSSPGVDA